MVRLVIPRETIVMGPGWSEPLRERGLDTIGGAYRSDLGRRVARSGTTDVIQVVREAGDGACWYLKRYWFPTLGRRVRSMLRGTWWGRSKVRREFENLNAMRAAGLDAPSPVAYGEERLVGFLCRSYLITEGIPAATALHEYIRRGWERPTGSVRGEDRGALLQALAAAVRRLHGARFVHGDLFWRNIVLAGGSLAHFYLLDTHKTRRWTRPVGTRGRALDLASLDAAAPWYFRRAERLRFYLAYAGRTRLRDSDRAFIRLILRLAEPMRERQLMRILGRASADQPHPTLLRPIPEFPAGSS